MVSLLALALTLVTNFGSNPGALSMYEYVPANLPAGRPLVVVLHGCTQSATAMENAGWNKLADQYQFAVLYPQQSSSNNPVSCFNWAGEYGDTANLVRGQGENQSIISMIDTMKTTRGIDTTKVYLTGFSAGGAFIPVMLATWPDRFAAASIMEGIPYRCATSVNGAYSCQSPGVSKTPAEWGDLVRAAHSYTGPRPRVQVWHGTSDTTVVPANQTELIDQWTNVLGADQTADETEMVGTVATRTAYKAGANVVVESYTVHSMGHAVAIGAEGTTTCPGSQGAYFESKAICSTLRAARFFGLIPGAGGGGSGGGFDAEPTVAIVSPANGDTVNGTMTVVVAAGDDVGVTSVSLSIDGAVVGADMEAPYQWPWDATAAGTGAHTLVATATDSAGRSTTSTVMVTVATGGGGGSNGGTGDGDDDEVPGLPACTLDAGKSDGRSWAPLLLAVALVLTKRRKR